MTSLRFDLDSTSKTLNLSLLRFNEQSGSENLGNNTTPPIHVDLAQHHKERAGGTISHMKVYYENDI